MRNEFSTWALDAANSDEKMIFLTGDLGFKAFESLKESIGDRFVNAGVSEQNMMSLAAGLASQGFNPVCYSIAPFAVFRPAEQIRLDIGLHNMNVKIVGNGGGYGYGIMGATHHALEDLAMLSAFPHMKCYVPFCKEQIPVLAEKMRHTRGPAYLRLAQGSWPGWQKDHLPVEKLLSGDYLTVVGCGPVINNARAATSELGIECDIFTVNELPLESVPEELIESVERTKRVLLVEEHVRRGGMGEHILSFLAMNRCRAKIKHAHAVGYPKGRYGSQNYHLAQSGLDVVGLRQALRDLLK